MAKVLQKKEYPKFPTHYMDGYIADIEHTKKISEKFTVRNFALDISYLIGDQEIDNYGLFTLQNTLCNIIDKFKPGDSVRVHFKLSGQKKPDGKVFNRLECFKIESIKG